MANNIEIKAVASDFHKQYEIAESISDSPLEVLDQTDTFFKVPDGRLKLREFPDQASQLIFYHRRDTSGPKLSDYHISETQDGANLKSVLAKAYGQTLVVKKIRHLFLVGRTRIHMDTVEGLGEFIELEVVLNADDDLSKAEAEAQALMKTLRIAPADLIQGAYADLLAAQNA